MSETTAEGQTTTTGPEATIARIVEAAPTVAAEAEAHSAAVREEREAEAAVLTAAINAARPALRAVSSRIKIGWRCWWTDNVGTDDRSTFDPDRRGVRLAGDAKPSEDYPRANRGEYEGEALYLLVDGTLVEVSYSGGWSRWQGEPSEWEAAIKPVSAAEAMAEWNLGECVESIAAALERQRTGRRVEATTAAKARAEKLRAVAALVGGK